MFASRQKTSDTRTKKKEIKTPDVVFDHIDYEKKTIVRNCTDRVPILWVRWRVRHMLRAFSLSCSYLLCFLQYATSLLPLINMKLANYTTANHILVRNFGGAFLIRWCIVIINHHQKWITCWKVFNTKIRIWNRTKRKFLKTSFSCDWHASRFSVYRIGLVCCYCCW